MTESAGRPVPRRLRLILLILASVALLIGSSYAVERLYLAPLRPALDGIRLHPPPPVLILEGFTLARWILDLQLWLMAGALAFCGLALGGGLDKHLKPMTLAIVGSVLLLVLLQAVAVVWTDFWLPRPLRRLFGAIGPTCNWGRWTI